MYIYYVQNTLSKVGPWGGNGGTLFEIAEAELPQRLESVTIHGGEVIDSIAFTYIGLDGARRTVGPFGGGGGIKQPVSEFWISFQCNSVIIWIISSSHGLHI